MQKTSARHPPGLYVLFFAEMWERFGYYLMVGILLLFLRDTISNGGRGLDNALATDIVGTYAALVYLTPFLGGLLADRYLGYRRSILLGGGLMAVGYFLLAIPGPRAPLVPALACVIIGNGFFKPNISTLLGNLYNKGELQSKKDAAFNIFYMGINIGAFVCNFVAAYLRNHYGWGYAFAAAGVGLLLAIVVFAAGMRHVKEGDLPKAAQPGDMPTGKILGVVLLPALAAAALGWFLPEALFGHTILRSRSNDAFVFASIPIVGFFVYLWHSAKGFDKKRIATLLIMFGVAILFWNIYNQNATALTIWADNYSDRRLPAGSEKFLKAFDLSQTINTDDKEVPVLDERLRAKLGPDGTVVTHQGIDPYFINLPKEEWPEKGDDLKLISTEIFQSVNPFWIVTLTPILLGFYGYMRARNKEPSTPTKMAWGIIISGVSSLVMVAACLSTNIYRHKVSSAWLVSSYGVFTVSEILLSPLGLSLTSKVAPKRLAGLMMGGWFLTTSLGGGLSGVLAGFWDRFAEKWEFFGISAALAIAAGVALLPLCRRLAVVVDEATHRDD